MHSLSSGKSKSTTNYDDMRKFFEHADIVIGHNIARWDIPHLERLLGIKIESKIVDTLFISWYLEPDKLIHGLEEWGEYFGVPKPPIADWETLPLEEYIHRCEEDVKINTLLWKKQFAELLQIYGTRENVWRFIDYLSFKADCAREQEEVGWKLDVERATANLEWFTKEFESKKQALKDAMPLVPNKSKKSMPKKMFNSKGEYTAIAVKWFEFLKEQGLPSDTEGVVEYTSSYKEPNPTSHSQVKDWLDSLGWIPETFKFQKNKETGETKNIPQINLERGEGICPSIKKLYEKEPRLEALDAYYVIKHRKEILTGFLANVDKNGYIQAQIQGLTNTLRFKHKVLVNLPKFTDTHNKDGNGVVDYRDGVHIRGCLIAPEGYELCGSDMSSLEDRTKQHYMWEHDPDYVTEMMTPDFDPHLDLAVIAGALTKEQADAHKRKEAKYNEERSLYKTVNYAATYGAGGATIARSAGVSVAEGKALHETYWIRNWSIKTIADLVKTKQVGNKRWLFNPVSKFWYSLRNDKDKFSTLNQGTGVFCFDCWVKVVRSKGAKLCGQFHDEICLPVKLGRRKAVTKILKDSVVEVNKALQLNRALDVGVDFGKNYSETH